MPGADGMSAKFMKNAFVGWTFTAGLYYPPDFDASKLVPMKRLQPKGAVKEQILNIRMMFPFTMICDACGEYNYTGTKFTSKVENIKHESYLGIKVYRFYGRCRHCWSEFTFKTDPKNSDYTMESGGKRTYEAWKDADMVEAQLKAEKENEKSDHMKALEQKSVDVAAEMQRLEDLDAIRTLNKRLGARDQSISEALEYLFEKKLKEQADEEELDVGESRELDKFKQAQDEERRRRIDEEVENGPEREELGSALFTGGSSSSSSRPSEKVAGACAALASNSAATPAEVALAQGAALAAAQVATAAKKSAVGARFSVKRKAESGETIAARSVGNPTEAEPAAKRPSSTDGAGDESKPVSVPLVAQVDSFAGTTVGSGSDGKREGIGLGQYDSDSS